MVKGYEDLPLLHTRNYDTQVFRDGETLKVVGSVQDVKPPGVYVEDDPEPLTIHHMQVVLDVEVESLTITDANVEFWVHPNDTCPAIVDHYKALIGVSVTRGYTRAVRELFGGPRACTHTTALLQAMGPVVIQSLWSLRTVDRREQGIDFMSRDPEVVEQTLQANLNTCHVWAEGSETVERLRAGEWGEAPVWITKRLEELGRSPDEWMSGRG